MEIQKHFHRGNSLEGWVRSEKLVSLWIMNLLHDCEVNKKVRRILGSLERKSKVLRTTYLYTFGSNASIFDNSVQKDRCIWQIYIFCKTEWRKFQTIAIKNVFYPMKINWQVHWNLSNTDIWKIALKHANIWKGEKDEKVFVIFIWHSTEVRYDQSIFLVPLLHSLWSDSLLLLLYTPGWGEHGLTWALPHSDLVIPGFIPGAYGTSLTSLTKALHSAIWWIISWLTWPIGCQKINVEHHAYIKPRNVNFQTSILVHHLASFKEIVAIIYKKQ